MNCWTLNIFKLIFFSKWEWVVEKPELAPETIETCEPSVLLAKVCNELIQEFEESKAKPKKAKATRKKKVNVALPPEISTQKPITKFFAQKKTTKITERKESKPKSEKNLKKEVIPKHIVKTDICDDTLDATDENLPDNFSFLVDDLLSNRFKRNLSIGEPSKSELVTSTPVNEGPRKKLITPSKLSEFKPKYEALDLEQTKEEVAIEDEEDSFDRMCK